MRRWYEPWPVRWLRRGMAISALICFPAFFVHHYYRHPYALIAFAASVVFCFLCSLILLIGRWRLPTSSPLCTYCGYNLTGLPDGHRCPECGETFTLAECFEYQHKPVAFRELRMRKEWNKSRVRPRGVFLGIRIAGLRIGTRIPFFDDSGIEYPTTRKWHEPLELRYANFALWACSIAAFLSFFLLRIAYLTDSARLWIVFGLSIAGVVVIQRRRWQFRNSAPLCTYCGYNLTGLPDGHRCPECGETFSLVECFAYQKDLVGYRRSKEREEWLKNKTPPTTVHPNGE